MHKNLEKILRIMIIFWAVYAFVEGCLFFLNIRLESVKAIWPMPVLAYTKLVEKIAGSIFLFLSAVCFVAQRDLEKYKPLIKISGFWAIFHGGLLIFLAMSQDYGKFFSALPSLHVWLPFYNQYLLLEGLALLSYSYIVYLWCKKHA